jgi:hypothetical protein
LAGDLKNVFDHHIGPVIALLCLDPNLIHLKPVTLKSITLKCAILRYNLVWTTNESGLLTAQLAVPESVGAISQHPVILILLGQQFFPFAIILLSNDPALVQARISIPKNASSIVTAWSAKRTSLGCAIAAPRILLGDLVEKPGRVIH